MQQVSQWRLEYVPVVAPGPSGQQAFHQDREDVRYRALYAGTGGGKTFAAVAEDLAVSALYPGSVGLACAPTISDLKDVLYPIFSEHLGVKEKKWGSHPMVSHWHKTDRVLTLRDGSEIWFMGLMDEDPGEGTTVNWIHVTEPRLVRKWPDVWDSLTRRLRRKGFQGAWVDTHSPTKELVDEWEGKGDPRYRVYRWSTKDAYEAGVIGREYYEDTIRRYHGARAKAILGGEYARPEGMVYASFNPSTHVQPGPKPGDPWIQAMSYGVDWGYTHAACITVWAWNGSKCWGVDEYWARYKTTPELIEEAQRLQEKWGRGEFWCGADEPGSVEQFNDAGLEADILPPEKRKVKDGTRQVDGKFHARELLIDPRMLHFLDEIEQYANKPDRDEPEPDAPDALDSGRYGIYGHERLTGGFAAGS